MSRSDKIAISTLFIPGTPKLACDVAGAGPLVVFLHGIGGNRTNWQAQLEVFGVNYRAAALDCRGYGLSEDYDGPLQFSDFTADLERALDFFEVRRAHIVGLSMGGRIAQQFYYLHPDRVATLTIVDSHPGFSHLSEAQRSDYVRARQKPLLEGKEPRDIAPDVVAGLAGPNVTPAVRQKLHDSIASLRKGPYLKSIEATVNQVSIGNLSEIDVPTHFVVGECDRLTTPDIMGKMASDVRNAWFTVISGAGHLTNIEKPEEFNLATLEFLLAHRDRADVARS
jgi:3-oxoadipate enol-lactonase